MPDEQDKQPTPGTSLALPVGSRANLKMLLEANKEGLAEVVPSYLTAEKLLKVVMLSAMNNPEILNCTKESVLRAVMISAQSGIEIGPQSGHLVPFKKKIKSTNGVPEHWVMEVQFIPDYRGLIGAAKRSGSITKAESHLVYTDDVFEVDWGSDKPLTHKPDFRSKKRSPEDVVAGYFKAKLPDGDYQLEIMTRAELEAIKGRSKASGSGPWQSDPGEMYRKTVTKRGMKYIPNLDDKTKDAIDHDNRLESGNIDAVGLLTDIASPPAVTGSVIASEETKSKMEQVAEKVAAQREVAAQEQERPSEPSAPEPTQSAALPVESAPEPASAPVEPTPTPIAPAPKPVTPAAAPAAGGPPPWAKPKPATETAPAAAPAPLSLEDQVQEMASSKPRIKPKNAAVSRIPFPEFIDRVGPEDAWTQEQYDELTNVFSLIPGDHALEGTVEAWTGLTIDKINAETMNCLIKMVQAKVALVQKKG